MSLRYAVLLTPVEVTTANRSVKFERTTGVGAATWTATLSTTPTGLTDWIASGDGGGYDLLKSLSDAMNTQDPNDDYTVAWETSSLDRTTGRITITNAAGHTFKILWGDAATTLPPEWFGWAPPLAFRGDVAVATSTEAVAITGPHGSSLLWHPHYAAAELTEEPVATSYGIMDTSVDGHMTSLRLQANHQVSAFTLADILAVDYGGAMGGEMLLEWQALTHDEVYMQRYQDFAAADQKTNQALVVWWEHASQGKWSVLVDSVTQATSPAVLDTTSRMHIVRLAERARASMGNIATKISFSSPPLWDVSLPLIAIDPSHAAAGGA